MKSIAHSMTPRAAAQAFYGQSDADFAKTVDTLCANDPRLIRVFENTRQRFLDSQDS